MAVKVYYLATVFVFFGLFIQISSNLEPFFDSQTLSVLCYNTKPLQDQTSSSGKIILPCPVPVPHLRSGRQELAAIGKYYTEPPPWLNVTLATIGQNFMKKNLVGFLYSTGLASLLVGTSVDALRVIASAGNITRPEKAGQRYLGNLLHFVFWAHGDIGSQGIHGGNWNQSTLFESLNLIRSVHEKVSHQTNVYKNLYTVPIVSREKDKVQLNEPLWEAFEKDVTASPLREFKNRPIFPPKNGGTQYYLNQFSMMLQFWAFVALPIMKPESALVLSTVSEEELLGYLHFWGFIAHVMGIQPQYNICLQPDIKTARVYYRKLLEEYFAPGLFQLDYETKVVLEVSVKGISRIFPFVDDTLAVKRFAEAVLGIETKNMQKVLSPQARIYESVLKNFGFFTHYELSGSAVKFVINGMLQVNAIENLGLNILIPSNFTNGILEYDQAVLQSTNLWLWLNDTNNGKRPLDSTKTWNNLK